MHQTALNRWTISHAYRASWGARSKALFDLFKESCPDQKSTSFSEYGCGPNQPFFNAVKSKFYCARYDINAWSTEVNVMDLNDPDFQAEKTDVAVLSGVMEYMNNPQLTIARLSQFHRYMLLSYHPVRNFHFTSGGVISEINVRAEKNGWRNHLSVEGFNIAIASSGYPLAIRKYGKQLLALIEFYP